MNNVTTFDNFPPFATNGSRNMNTESAKYAVGFLEGETFPAEWANYLFHGATKGVSDLNTAVQSIWKENINVIQGSGQTPSPSDNTQLKTAIELMIQNAVLTANSQVLAQARLEIQNAVSTAKSQVLAQAKLDAHPVHSLYWSSDPTDPSILFGGTWVRIKDRFVLATGDTYGNGATGGSATVSLIQANLPVSATFTIPSLDLSINSASTAHVHSFTTDTTTNNSCSFSFGCFSSVHWKAYPLSGCTSYKAASNGSYNPSGGTTTGGNNDAISINFNHSHSGTTNGMSKNETHTHTGSTTAVSKTISDFGSGTAFDILPPYITKYCWERTA